MLSNILSIIPFLLTGAQSSRFGMSSMPPTILTLQMIIDFAVEQRWKQLVFFDCIGHSDCSRTYAKPLMHCLSDEGIQTSIKSLTDTSDLMRIFSVGFTKLGVVIIVDDIDIEKEDNLFYKLRPLNKTIRPIVLGAYVSWLIVSTKWNNTQMFNAVKDWPIGLDTDFSVAMSFLSADVIHKVLNQFENNTCKHLQKYGQVYNYERLRRSQSISPPEKTFVQKINDSSKTISVFYVATVYKIRTETNESLELESWETWTPSRRTIRKERIVNKLRTNLKHHIMNFGLLNISGYYDPLEDNRDPDVIDHASSVESLLELINLFVQCLNVSANITSFRTSQSSSNNELVNAIVNGNIDLGAAYLDADLDRAATLSFSYPIVHYTRTIFFKPPETSSNIFLQPFSKKMLLCVLATLVLIVGVMEIINYVTLFIHWKEDRAHFGLGEATLWCISIMAMQGSPWTPRTRAGKTVLLGSLMFSLITYNAYSASITSILSVKTYAINNVSDFFDYDYIFGCSSDDDVYLSTKGELSNFYVKTLENHQNKVPEQTGLERTIKGNYAFFVTETVAKRILRNALLFKRCEISELHTKTPGTLNLPMSNNSPYKKIINISILRMWQSGILRKLSLQINPPLLNCDGILQYKQAQFMDVYGAFVVLLAGALGAVAIFFMERTWAERKKLADIHIHLPGHHEDDSKPTPTPPKPAQAKISLFQTARLSVRILRLQRAFREKRDKLSSMYNDYDSGDVDSYNRGVRNREFTGDYSRFKRRNNELQFVRYSRDEPPLFPYCP